MSDASLPPNIKLTSVTCLLPIDDLSEIDRRVAARREKEPRRQISRSDIIRELVACGLHEKTRAR